MKFNKKIPAFTLNEMVVVLIITAIVVGLAFSMLTITQKHMLGIQSNYIKKNAIQRLEQSLWIDFNRYRKAEYFPEEQKLVFSHSLDTVNYFFYDTYTLKNNDTIAAAVKNKKIYRNGMPFQKGIIDALELKSSENDTITLFFIYKKNDAAFYMNNGF